MMELIPVLTEKLKSTPIKRQTLDCKHLLCTQDYACQLIFLGQHSLHLHFCTKSSPGSLVASYSPISFPYYNKQT